MITSAFFENVTPKNEYFTCFSWAGFRKIWCQYRKFNLYIRKSLKKKFLFVWRILMRFFSYFFIKNQRHSLQWNIYFTLLFQIIVFFLRNWCDCDEASILNWHYHRHTCPNCWYFRLCIHFTWQFIAQRLNSSTGVRCQLRACNFWLKTFDGCWNSIRSIHHPLLLQLQFVFSK